MLYFLFSNIQCNKELNKHIKVYEFYKYKESEFEAIINNKNFIDNVQHFRFFILDDNKFLINAKFKKI